MFNKRLFMYLIKFVDQLIFSMGNLKKALDKRKFIGHNTYVIIMRL